MSNIVIGDKIPTSIQPPSAERAGEQGRSLDGKRAADTPKAPADPVALSSPGPARADRPLSTRISNPQQAMVALLELKGRLQRAPEQALEAHAGIRSGADHGMNQALNRSA